MLANFLILFIIRALKNNSDASKTVDSFVVDTTEGRRSLISQAILVDNVQHTQKLLKKLELESNFGWYGILYDNEHISVGLRYTLSYHLHGSHDVVQVIKDEDGGMVQSPRFFRRNVALLEESLMPSNLQDLKYSVVMDGWIKSHVL